MKQWGKREFWGLDSSFDPDWILTESQIELRSQLMEACRTVIRPQAIRSDKTYEFPTQSIHELAKLRLLGLIVPKELGGRGENNQCMAMIIETLARYGGASIALIYSMHLLSLGPLILSHKGNKLITDLLQRLDKDKLIGTGATSDPATGGHFWSPPSSKVEKLSDNELRVLKFSSWCTSAGYADFCICLVPSPNHSGDLSAGSVVLAFKDEIRASTEEWAAMGARGNQSGPFYLDEVFKTDRLVGGYGATPLLTSESIIPIFSLGMASTWNGVAMSAIDITKQHVTRKTHGDTGFKVAQYPSIQDSVGKCIASTNACRTSTFFIVAAMDKATNNNTWNYENPQEKLREPLTLWGYQIKYTAAENASKVADAMLNCCGGDGYKEDLGLERIVRDSKAGPIMAISSEVSRNLFGKIALLGPDSVDLWEKQSNLDTVHHEVKKMTLDEKRELRERLTHDINNGENQTQLKHPYQDSDFDNPFSTSQPSFYNVKELNEDGVSHSAGLDPLLWIPLTLLSKAKVTESMTSFVFSLPKETEHIGCYAGQYIQMRAIINGKEHTRSFSPISPPNEYGKIELAMRFESQGIISKFFQNLQTGAEVEFKGPCGGFEYEANKLDQITILAAGAGITPGLQLIRTVHKNSADNTKINLIYFSEAFKEILCYDELKDYSDNDPRISILFTLREIPNNWDGEEGFIDEQMIKSNIPPMNGLKHKIILCGGPTMAMSCLNALRKLKYQSHMIFIYGQFGTELLRMAYGRNIKLSGHSLLCDDK